jgi:hypothetical protein
MIFFMDKIEDQKQKCIEWITLQKVTKTFNDAHTSYAYKHMVERWSGTYITEASFREAVKILQIRYKVNSLGNFLMPFSELILKRTRGYSS